VLEPHAANAVAETALNVINVTINQRLFFNFFLRFAFSSSNGTGAGAAGDGTNAFRDLISIYVMVSCCP
jgi:hypothetical protein